MGGEDSWCGHISETKDYETKRTFRSDHDSHQEDGTTIHMCAAENRNKHGHAQAHSVYGYAHTVSQDTEHMI